MPAGRQELRKPDIVLLKRGKDAGLQAFPVMTESPGEMVYAMGLYIGDNIRLYYNAPGEKARRPAY